MRESEQTTPALLPGEQEPLGWTATANRRAAVRGLAAALFALAGGGAAMAEAKKTSRKKARRAARKKRRSTCRRGRVLANLAVPGDGTEIFTPVLKSGQRYTLRASGFWSTNGAYLNDAVAAFLAADPNQVAFVDLGVRLGLSLDGRSPDIWGPYSQEHEYTTSVIGQERRVPMRMQDSDYADNGRLLNVAVICG